MAACLLFSVHAWAAEPAVSAVSRDLVTSYTWGYKTGVKQQHGSYKNGRSVHAVLRRNGTTGEYGYPDYLIWHDEHSGLSTALERAVAYPTVGKNPATHAVFISDAVSAEQGKFWWVMGGRADSQPFDLVRSVEPFNPTILELALNNFVTEPQSTTPGLAVVGEDGLLAYRWRASGSISGQIRFQNYFLPAAGLPQLRFEKTLGRASGTSAFGEMTLEQLWTRWDPRKSAFGVTWLWYAHAAATGVAFGSSPFLYTEDKGVTWKSAAGAPVTLPLEYATASVNPVITPYEHFTRGEDSGWLPRDLGFTPAGAPWVTQVTGPIRGSSDGWRLTFFRWDGNAWQSVVITNAMQGNTDAVACGPVRDYLVCAYSELNTPGALLVRTSRNDGRTWSAPVTVDDVGLSSTGGMQRISWVSYAQPADRYLDNTARFFLSYYRVDEAEGMAYKNRMRWVRVQVGPRADFNGDEIVNATDLSDFEAAYAAGDWRADFNDDGVASELDRSGFTAALESEGPDDSTIVPDVVGLTEGAATSAIANAALLLGAVTQQSSATVQSGRVISQNPTAGTSVADGSAVDLVVSTGPATVNVPDVVGLTQSSASAAIANAGLQTGTVTQQLSPNVPAGDVISQDPIAGTTVNEGSQVALVVSSGAPAIVPDVVGLSQSPAATAITSAGLVVGAVTSQSSASVPAGDVISQNPGAGTNVAAGSSVSLVVSTGAPTAIVPNVVGMTQSAASTAITTARLVVGTVTQQSSANVPAGNVISQDPPAGSSVAEGAAVNLTVSTGSAPVSVPNVVGLTQSAAATAITTSGLVVGTVTQQSSDTVAAGSVISQNPGAGTSVAAGSSVNLVVSTGVPTSASGSASPMSVAFGNRMLNVAAPGQAVTIANTGTIALPITSTSLSGNNPGQFSRSSYCPSQLAVGGTCTVTVVFKPTSTGNKSANLVIALGGGAGNKTVTLTGTGVNYSFTVSPTSLAFGNVARGTTSAAKTVTVQNSSSVGLPITSIALGGSNAGQYSSTNNCPTQLSAGESCTVSVFFKPTSKGNKSATLVVTPGNGVAAKSVALNGKGT